MFSLPRGTGVDVDVPLASAAWESPRAVERLVYRGNGALFVGAIPAFENWEQLRALYDCGNEAYKAVETSGHAPLKRAEKIDELEKLWREVQRADCIPLGFDDDRHFVTIAGSRSGKGTSAIIPNLCIYPGSVVCLDPKGENATLTALRRGEGDEKCEGLGQEVFVLDPFGVADVPEDLLAGFNPLARLDPKSDMVVNDAELLAEGLIVPTKSEDAHWDDSARNFIKGLILHLITTKEQPTLLTLRHFLTCGDDEGWIDTGDALFEAAPDEAAKKQADRDYYEEYPSAFEFLLKTMQASEHKTLAGIIAGAAGTLLDCGEKERGSILSTARRNTAFLDTLAPSVIETLEGKGRTFSPDIFKTSKTGASLYLCLPAERMGTHGRWLRLMIGLLLESAYRNSAKPACGAPFLFLLEECYALGHMAVIEKAAGYAAGFGIKLWAVLQDLQQLKALYPQSWQTFLANAGAIQVFGVSDADTTGYVCQALGDIETIKHIVNRNSGSQSTETHTSVHKKASGVVDGRNRVSMVRTMMAMLPHESTSENDNESEAVNEQLQIVPLLRPYEIALQFARETGAQLLLIKGRQPIWCLRVDYYSAPWFRWRYIGGDKNGHKVAFGERSPYEFQKKANAFSNLAAKPFATSRDRLRGIDHEAGK